MRDGPAVTERVAPRHEEEGLGAGRGDLPVQVTRERIGAATPLLLRKREQPALLLEDHDVPLDVPQKLRQPAVLVSLPEAPSGCGVLDGIDRLSSGIAGREVVYERRQRVLEGEAVADEQHAQTWLAA